MPAHASDALFAKFVTLHSIATSAQIDAAQEFQADCARKGAPVTLADALVRLGVITPAQRDNVELRLLAQPAAGLTRLLHYQLLKKIGEGGMGAVYLAEDSLLHRRVALKVLPRERAANADFLRRFQHEADAMGRLSHVNIVRAFSVGEDQGRHFFVMEYCDGETLDRRIKRDGFIPWDEALGILVQVARGLQYAHALGVLHRDIKPGNVILAGSVAKILDLGLSKDLAGDDASHITQSGVAMGTPHYMSPEQARGEKHLDDRADIYSAGAMFYHLLTGDTPFHGSSAFELVTHHLHEQIPDPRDLREDIPDGVVHIIRRMMAKRREDRYRHCGELLQDLERVAGGLPPRSQAIDAALSSVAMPRAVPVRRATATLRAPSTAHAPPKTGHAARPDSRMRYGIAGGMGLLALLAVTALLRGGGDTPPPATAPAKPRADKRPAPAQKAPAPPAPSSPPEMVASADDLKTVREATARRQLEDVRRAEREGLAKDLLLGRYEGLIQSHGDTKAGREAREILDRLKATASVPAPDNRPAPAPPPQKFELGPDGLPMGSNRLFFSDFEDGSPGPWNRSCRIVDTGGADGSRKALSAAPVTDRPSFSFSAGVLAGETFPDGTRAPSVLFTTGRNTWLRLVVGGESIWGHIMLQTEQYENVFFVLPARPNAAGWTRVWIPLSTADRIPNPPPDGAPKFPPGKRIRSITIEGACPPKTGVLSFDEVLVFNAPVEWTGPASRVETVRAAK